MFIISVLSWLMSGGTERNGLMLCQERFGWSFWGIFWALKQPVQGSGWAITPELFKIYVDVTLRDRVWVGVGGVRLDSVIWTDSMTSSVLRFNSVSTDLQIRRALSAGSSQSHAGISAGVSSCEEKYSQHYLWVPDLQSPSTGMSFPYSFCVYLFSIESCPIPWFPWILMVMIFFPILMPRHNFTFIPSGPQAADSPMCSVPVAEEENLISKLSELDRSFKLFTYLWMTTYCKYYLHPLQLEKGKYSPNVKNYPILISNVNIVHSHRLLGLQTVGEIFFSVILAYFCLQVRRLKSKALRNSSINH